MRKKVADLGHGLGPGGMGLEALLGGLAHLGELGAVVVQGLEMLAQCFHIID